MSEEDIRGADVDPSEELEEHEGTGAEEIDIEAPEADAADQQRPIREEVPRFLHSVPDDVDPADAADQSRVVEFDEDDYR